MPNNDGINADWAPVVFAAPCLCAESALQHRITDRDMQAFLRTAVLCSHSRMHCQIMLPW